MTIEKFEDLGLDAVDEVAEGEPEPTSIEEANKQRVAKAEALIKEKLGISAEEMKQALSNYVSSHGEELALELVNIAPLGDYGKLLEDNDSMAEFLKTEAHKVEYWRLSRVRPNDVNPNLISFEFANTSIDEGESFQGFVFVSMQGKIRHAFAQGCDN